MSRCVDLRRSMCRLLKIDVSTFGDGCVDLRRPMIDVSTFEDRWLMCRPSKIDSRCVDLRTSMVDVKLGCYTCSIAKYWYYSCMRITPRVCTSVLSLQCGRNRTTSDPDTTDPDWIRIGSGFILPQCRQAFRVDEVTHAHTCIYIYIYIYMYKN